MAEYFNLLDAKKEIIKRFSDKTLREKIDNFLEGDIPSFLKNEPHAFLTRYVATPDNEFVRFFEKSTEINLKPVCWEYNTDKFVTINEDKAYLAKLLIFTGYDKNLSPKFISKRIIDLSGVNEGRKFYEIRTLEGENFVEFHHRLIKSMAVNVQLFDASDWHIRQGSSADKYYEKFLAIFCCYGILFENYLSEGSEKVFTENIFLKSYENVVKKIGVKPIIVQAVPEDELDTKYWWSYPSDVIKYLDVTKP